MILIFLAWVVLFFVVSLLGLTFYQIASRIVSKRLLPENIKWYEVFWLGIIFLILLLQIFSLFFPINKYFWVLILIINFIAFVFYLLGGRVSIGWFQKKFVERRNLLFFIILGAVILLSVCYNASRNVVWYDTYMYHLNAVRWVSYYKVVPGLVHIDSLYGFNSSFFLFGAMTDELFFTGKSSHIALSFLIVVIIVQWLYVIFLEKRVSLFERIFCLGTFPLLLHKAWANELPSLSTDLASLIIFFALSLFLISQTKIKHLILAGLGAILVSFKLSGLIAASFVFAFILLSAYRFGGKDKKDLRLIYFSVITFLLILAGFIVRNIFVSGWLFYPFPYFGNLYLPWSTSIENVSKSLWVIKAWARMPGVHHDIVANMTLIKWLVPWFENFKIQIEFKLFLLSLMALILTMSIEQIRKYLGNYIFSYSTLIIINITSLFFWFYAAPDLRFGQQYYWAFFATALYPLISYFLKSNGKRNWWVIYSLVFFLSIFMAEYFPKITEVPQILTLKKEESLPVDAIVASPPGENPPLILWVPVKGDQCGNSQLPCSTEKRKIRQIVPGDISKGFLPYFN